MHTLTSYGQTAYWIAFGPHGPRALPDPQEKWEIMKLIGYCLAASAAIFGTIRYFAGPAPKTMTKEWQEMTNDYLKVRAVVTFLNSRGSSKDADRAYRHRHKRRKPSRVFLPRDTRVLA